MNSLYCIFTSRFILCRFYLLLFQDLLGLVHGSLLSVTMVSVVWFTNIWACLFQHLRRMIHGHILCVTSVRPYSIRLLLGSFPNHLTCQLQPTTHPDMINVNLCHCRFIHLSSKFPILFSHFAHLTHCTFQYSNACFCELSGSRIFNSAVYC